MDPHFEQDEAVEPFRVDVFSKQHRFFPHWSVAVLTFLWRWSLYVFVPVALFAGGCYATHYFLVRSDLEPTEQIGIAFCGVVLPLGLLLLWLRRAPYWYLNGTDREWNAVSRFCEDNGHVFPNDFHEPPDFGPFRSDLFDTYQAYGFDDNVSVTNTIEEPVLEVDGFVLINMNLGYEKPFPWASKNDPKAYGFYLDTAYFSLERYGLRFFGERINVFVPYGVVHRIVRCGWPLDFILKLNAGSAAPYTDLRVTIGHCRTMAGDFRLRDELVKRIQTAKAVDLLEQMVALTEEATD